MGESFHHHQQLQQQQHQSRQSSSSSRLGLRHSGVGGGEIVEVQGGRIVRSTGRKDRHSKVCTAKGPRDRRVRLSAHTAIQFYDVQDRLGYDRPSKAVDWLIKKAKSAIDELAELPAWTPTTAGLLANSNFEQEQTTTAQKQEAGNHQNPQQQQQQQQQQHQQHLSIHHGDVVGTISTGPSGKRAMTMLLNDGEQQQSMHHTSAHQSANSSSFLPPSLDSDSIADTIKSFFPMGASAEANSSPMQFQSFPPPDLLSRTSSQSQDLRLSLQSFQDPMLLHHHHHHSQQAQHHHTPTSHTEQVQAQAQAQVQAHAIFSGHSQLGFDVSGWSEHQQPADISRFHRLAAYAGGGASSSGGAEAAAGGGYLFNSQPAPPQPLLQQLFGQNQLFSQRGPLQSSNTPSVRAWMDPSSAITIATSDHIQTQNQHHHHHHHALLPIYPSGIGFASGGGGFSGFHIPARIQGEEEEHDGLSDKPSSASSDSRH